MTDYATLQAAIAAWLDRTDLTAVIPSFIALAEEDIGRDLRVREMESPLSETSTNCRIVLPSATAAVKNLWISATNEPLRVTDLDSVIASKGATATIYAVQGCEIVLNADASVSGVTYERPTPLSSNSPTNGVLAAYPSLYLYGAMRYACAYLKDAEGEASYAAQFAQRVAAVSGSDMRDRFTAQITSRSA